MIRAASLAALLVLACACGQKGPLKLPDAKAGAVQGAVPPPAPATPQPATAPPSSP
jgi:predicted small lipoprotein YifL